MRVNCVSGISVLQAIHTNLRDQADTHVAFFERVPPTHRCMLPQTVHCCLQRPHLLTSFHTTSGVLDEDEDDYASARSVERLRQSMRKV